MEITKKILMGQKTITNVIFTFEFEPIEQIQREIYTFETNLKSLFPDEAIDTRVPQEYNPSTPRFILRHDKKKRYLEISQDRAVLKFIITGSHATIPTQGLSYFNEKCKLILQKLKDLINPNFFMLSHSTHLNYSLTDYSQEEIASFYSDRFLNHKNITIPKKFTFTTVYEEQEQFLVSFNFQEYEQMQFKIDTKNLNARTSNGAPKFFRVRKNDPNVIIQDYGLKIVVDVNNSLKMDKIDFDDNPSQSLKNISAITLNKVQKMEDFLL